MKRPMLAVALLGVATSVIAFYIRPLMLALAIIFVLSITVLIIFKTKISYILVALLMLLFAVRTLTVYNSIDRINTFNGQTVESSFTIVQSPDYYGESSSSTVAICTEGVLPAGVKMSIVSYENASFNVGDRITAEVKISAISRPYSKSYYSDGIYGKAVLKEKYRLNGTNRFLAFTGKTKEYVTETFYRYFSPDIAATLNAVLTGDKLGFTDDFRDNITTTGVDHVMVVSGMHLAILLGSLFSILDRLFYNRYLRFALSVIAVAFICSVCGFSISILRAGFTFVICAAAGLCKRENDSLNSLGAAVYILMFISPFAVFSPAFQLSVLSTFAVIVPAPFYYGAAIKRFGKTAKIFAPIIKSVFTTVLATIMVMPVLIWNFGSVSVIAILTNLLITYFVTWALIFSAVGLVLGIGRWGEPLLRICFLIAGLCAEFINAVINLLSKIPYARVFIETESTRYAMTVFSILVIILILLFMYTCNVNKSLLKLKKPKIKEV